MDPGSKMRLFVSLKILRLSKLFYYIINEVIFSVLNTFSIDILIISSLGNYLISKFTLWVLIMTS